MEEAAVTGILPDDLLAFAEKAVADGAYDSVEAVIEAGVRRLREDDDDLNQRLRAALAEVDPDEPPIEVTYEEHMRAFEAKVAAHRLARKAGGQSWRAMSFRLSRLALRDLGAYEDYVAFELGDIDGARKAIHRFYAAFERVGRRPMMARPRPDLGPEIRSVPVGRHIVRSCPVRWCSSLSGGAIPASGNRWRAGRSPRPGCSRGERARSH